jgi:hypothetical protein
MATDAISSNGGNGGAAPTTIYGIAFKAAKDWGLFAVLVVFFIWRMEFVNEDTNKFVREKLLDALDRNTTAWGTVADKLALRAERGDRSP